jgi:hypothetical protein
VLAQARLISINGWPLMFPGKKELIMALYAPGS